MKTEHLNVQKSISIFIAITGILVVCGNIIHMIALNHTVRAIIFRPTVLGIFLFSLVFFLIRNIDNIIIPVLQALMIYINGIFAILDDYEAFNGYGFIIIFILMLYKYKMLERFTKTKLLIIAFSVVFFLEYSLFLNTDYPIGQSLNHIVYFAFFFSMIYLLYSSELNRILKAEKRFKETLESKEDELRLLTKEVEGHNKNIKRKEKRIDKLNSEIKALREPLIPLDLYEYGITQREESIIRELCLNTDLANKEIAANLGISEGTIKQNLNKVYKKLGVSSRQKMIESCQRNFIENPSLKSPFRNS